MDQFFYWSGVITIGVATGVGLVVVGLCIFALWQNYGPTFICRRPGAINVWSTYRSDVRTGEGKRVKSSEDMRVTRLIGVAWRFRWFFGLVLFEKDVEE